MREVPARVPVDTLIRNAWIVTMDAGRRIFRDGAIAILGDRIHAVGPSAEVEAAVVAREVIDGSRFVLTPGFVNGNAADMMRAMFMTAGLHKDARRDSSLCSSYAALECGTLNGVAGGQLSHQIGSLEPGKKADIVAHDRRGVALRPRRGDSARADRARGQDGSLRMAGPLTVPAAKAGVTW